MRKYVLALSITVFALVFAVTLYAGHGKEGKYCNFSDADCSEHIKAYYSAHGWLGMEKEKGAEGHSVITKVIAGSPAEKAGLAPGDEILAYNGTDITDHESCKLAKSKLTIGSDLVILIRRNGEKREMIATLTAIPEPILEAKINRHFTESHEVASKK